MNGLNLLPEVLKAYPQAETCIELGQHDDDITSYFYEINDDKAQLMKTSRCKRCHMPVGGDDYASLEETERYEQNRHLRTPLA